MSDLIFNNQQNLLNPSSNDFMNMYNALHKIESMNSNQQPSINLDKEIMDRINQHIRGNFNKEQNKQNISNEKFGKNKNSAKSIRKIPNARIRKAFHQSKQTIIKNNEIKRTRNSTKSNQSKTIGKFNDIIIEDEDERDEREVIPI